MLGRAAVNLYVHHGAEWAGSLAYYSLLSVFPAALLGVTIAATFVNEAWAVEQIAGSVARILPTVSDAVARDVREAISARNQVGAFAIVILAWSGSRVFSTLTHAIDQALGRAHRVESFFLSLGREVVLLGGTGFILFVGTTGGFAIEVALKHAHASTMLATFLIAAARLALFGGAIFGLIYFVPFPRPPRRAALTGSSVATLLLVVAMPLFSTYVSKLGKYNLIYGPVAIVMIVLVWFWVASVMLLFGAHVTALVESRYSGARDSEHHSP